MRYKLEYEQEYGQLKEGGSGPETMPLRSWSFEFDAPDDWMAMERVKAFARREIVNNGMKIKRIPSVLYAIPHRPVAYREDFVEPPRTIT